MQPIAFQLGPLTVTWYGLMMAVGFLLGLWTASRRGLRSGFSGETVFDVGTWLIIGTIVGARTLHVITYWNQDFAGKPIWEIFMVHKGGLVFYGGLIGASTACVLYVWRRKLPLWRFADVLAPSIPLGYVFGRIGCLFNGCCYGRACDLPWAITYPDRPGLPDVPVHPTQVYESLFSLALYLALAWLYRRKKFDGQVFAAYLMVYAVTRSIVELFRGDYIAEHIFGGLTPAQLVSIGIFATGAVMYAVLRQRKPQFGAPATTA